MVKTVVALTSIRYQASSVPKITCTLLDRQIFLNMTNHELDPEDDADAR